jgi:mono/diheme cytochrome c family protein
VKLALFGPLLALAAFNLLVLSPRLKRLAGKMDRAARETAATARSQFRRVVLAEAGIAVLILFAAGALISNSPGNVSGFTPEGPFRPFILRSGAEGLNGRLVLSPGRIGLNRFDLTVTTTANQPPPDGTEVVLRISTLDQDTGTNEARMEAAGGGRFTTTGTYLSTVGFWEIAALVRRPGVDEVRLPFQLSLTSLTGQAEVRENRPAAPIERGRELFANNCIQCHGATGRGDGPLAAALQPRPVDLTVHVPLHTDREIFEWITNGVPRTAMPAFKDAFTEEEIQAIINYLRQIAEQANQER